MPKSYPPDVLVLDTDGLLHARVVRGRKAPRIAQAKSYRFAGDPFRPGPVTPELVSEAVLVETLRRVRNETGKWDRVSLLLPDSWFRMNIIEVPAAAEKQGDPKEVIRWSLKRTLPLAPEDLRIAHEVLGRTATHARILVVSAMEKALAAIEKVLAGQGIETILIEPLGLNLWNAVAARENGSPETDRLFVYVRDREFTTAVFRGSQPIFLRSRNLSAERPLHQELRLSASYLRDSLRTESFAQCYVAGPGAAEAAGAIGEEFASPVRTVALRDVVEEMPEGAGTYEAELTACAGVFTG